MQSAQLSCEFTNAAFGFLEVLQDATQQDGERENDPAQHCTNQGACRQDFAVQIHQDNLGAGQDGGQEKGACDRAQ